MIKKKGKRSISKFLVLTIVVCLIINLPISVYADNSKGTTFATGLHFPIGMAFDSSGNLFVANWSDNNVKKFDSNGNFINNFGTGFSGPLGIVVDSNGNVYITNEYSNTVKKFDAAGNFLKDIGTGFNRPTGIALDSSENIYVVNSSGHNVMKFNSNGDYITTLGTGLILPYGIAVDNTGNIYVADRGNDAVKKMDSNGNNIITLGTGFIQPSWVTLDSSGNIYVACWGGGRVEEMDASGNPIATIGTGYDRLYAMIFDNNSNMYIADSGHNEVDKILGLIGVPTISDINVINGTTKANIGLPQNVNVTLSNSTTKSVPVNWDTCNPAYDGNKAGTYVFTGTLATPQGVVNPNNKRVSVNVVVRAPSVTTVPSIPNINVVNGTTQENIGLPQNINVTLSNSTTTSMPITWDTCNPAYDGNKAGTYAYTGTLTMPQGVINPDNKKATVNVVVESKETIKGNIVDKNGQSVRGVEAQVTTEADGTKTVKMKASEAVLLEQADGTKAPFSDASKLGFQVDGNANVSIAADGNITVNNLAKGTSATISVTYDLGNGQKITVCKITVTVDSNGNTVVTSTLIDPYGTITDKTTGKVITGANVKLYYANTARNIAAGKTPDTLVPLPIIDGFKPNDNKNPQISDTSGAYGFMVFPNSDYYVVATKAGYEDFKSPTISVEKEIVKYDMQMTPAKAAMLVQTGYFIDTNMLIFVGIVFMTAGFIFIRKKRA